MKRRSTGLTLLELLLAVALLGALTLGLSWFTRTATARARSTEAALQQERATEALFLAIGRDLQVGDADAVAVEGGRSRVAAEGTVLKIATRSTVTDAGALVREYRFEPEQQVLRGRQLPPVEPAGSQRGADALRPSEGEAATLLGGVTAFRSEVDAKRRLLKVDLELDGSRSYSREWVLP